MGRLLSIAVLLSFLSTVVQIRENTDQKKLRIWTLFTQCISRFFREICNIRLYQRKGFFVIKNKAIVTDAQNQVQSQLVQSTFSTDLNRSDGQILEFRNICS